MMRDDPSPAGQVLCFGEVLWDSVPDGLFLGGAPLNVAAHARRLGMDAAMVSAVGDDVLGHEIRRRVAKLGVDSGLIQTHVTLPTGFVDVELHDGIPSYTIREPAAWDHIALTTELLDRAASSNAIVFGSLAQRSDESRETLKRLRAVATFRVFDLNLRPPDYSRECIVESLRESDLVKLNDDELTEVAGWHSWTGSDESHCRRLAADYQVDAISVTRGSAGASLLHNQRWIERPALEVSVADTIGAGDAFLAGLLCKMLRRESGENALDFAIALGGLVAGRRGAIPEYQPSEIRS